MTTLIHVILTSSFFSSLASLVEFVNEEKSSLLKLVEKLKETKTVQHANFIMLRSIHPNMN